MREEIIGDCRLILGDCLEILPTLGKVDAVVTDPPYGIGIARRGTLGTERLAAVKDYGVSDWDDSPCSPEILAQMRSISDWQIIFGGNYFDLPPTSCWLIWDKQNTGEYADCEMAWTNMPKAIRRVHWLWNGMIRKGHEERFHPTQKPLGVMIWCLGQLPEGCNAILDPFMGSGTTGEACVSKGLAFTGIERDVRYYEIALRRIEQAYKQPRLFAEPKPKPKQVELL